MTDLFSLAAYDFDLPDANIAQTPIEPRHAARLLVLDPATGTLTHHTVADLPRLLPPGTLLVVNDTRVVPARLLGHKESGGRVELLLTRLDHAGKGIILLHDTRPQTAKMLPALLRELKTRGYKVVHIVPTKGDAPTALSKAEPGWTSETEANIAKVWPKILAEKRRLAKGAGQGG